MNGDRVEGTVNKAAGRVQEAVGALTGNDEHRGEGVARQVQGAAQDLYGQACDQVKEVTGDLAARVERNPLGALAVAGLVGYVLGVLSRR